MLIERLALRNFKRFEDAEIHFRDGITGIVGNNGTGKSSIVEAILFALFGIQGTGVQSEYIVSSFADERAKCEVRLDFVVGGERYSVVRSFRKRGAVSHEAQLNMGERLLATGVSEVAAEIERLCGMGPSDFRNTVYAAQKDLLALLEVRPGARKEWFMQVLGIEKLKTASDEVIRQWVEETEASLEREKNRLEVLAAKGDATAIPALEQEIKDIARVLRGKYEEKALLEEADRLLGEEATLGEARAALEEKLRQKESELLQLAGARERLESLAPALGRLAEITAELEAMKKKEREYLDLRDRIAQAEAAARVGKARLLDLSDQIEAYTAEAGELASLSPVASRLAQARDLLSRLEKAQVEWRALSDLSALAGRIRGEIEECEGKARVLRERLEGASRSREKRSELESRLRQLGTRAAQLETRAETLRKEEESLSSDRERILSAGPGGTCPLCHQVLGDHYPRIEREYAERIARIEGELDEILSALSACREEEERTEGEIAAIDRDLVEFSHVERGLHEAVARKENLEERLREVEEERASRAGRLEALGVGEYSPDIHEKTRGEVAALEKMAERLRELQFHQERLGALVAERDGLLREMEGEMARCRSLVQALESLGYDPVLKAEREEEFRSLQASRDEALILQERLAREADIRAERDAIRAELEALGARLSSCRENLGRLGFLSADRSRLASRLREISGEISSLDTRSGILQERLSSLRAVVEEQERAKGEIAALEKRAALLRVTRRTVAEFVLYLAGVIRADIEEEVSRILAEITSGRYDRVLVDEDFNILVRDIDGDYPISRYSGGEQDDIAVALRVALSRYISGLHSVRESTFLVFDEIFGSQDEERRANLLQALRSQEAHFPQIILISHIPEIQGEFAHTLLVEMVDSQRSRIVEVT
ncbi:MAG: SMC family ATPase [Methanolinea sp.]|nr:SMC family ATPase [Methanolinea sp.]